MVWYWLFRYPLLWSSASDVFAHYYWIACFFFSLICMSSLYFEYISTIETKRKKKVVYWMKGVLYVPLVAKDNWLLTLVRK